MAMFPHSKSGRFTSVESVSVLGGVGEVTVGWGGGCPKGQVSGHSGHCVPPLKKWEIHSGGVVGCPGEGGRGRKWVGRGVPAAGVVVAQDDNAWGVGSIIEFPIGAQKGSLVIIVIGDMQALPAQDMSTVLEKNSPTIWKGSKATAQDLDMSTEVLCPLYAVTYSTYGHIAYPAVALTQKEYKLED
ncbi:hypothetical protein EDD18DRAFT_1111477 [Armillaria luteobubalina]|uniref:Uncharacterized protein n=1 Tax=Armillaria luteobubalina TaxID=153913 RepID=A0AA39PK43_9AGAR|nr:hypothetical protein EDD18DRAFT_1111477 [Armillaria luteobubalina]